MAGLMDILLALVKVLCGSSTTQEEAPVHEKPLPDVPTTVPRRPQFTQLEQELRPLPSRPPPARRPRQEQELKPLPSQPPRPRQEQEPKPLPSQPLPPAPQPYQDQKQVNKHDEHYTSLRAKAIEQGDLMARCFQESHEAYSRGNGAHAKELSQKGKQHERTMESLNAEASAWIFAQNNLDGKAGEIDLHGLYVKEAVSYVDKAIHEARQRGDAEIRLIVGKGLHSNGHVAKIKPAIEDLMKKNNIPTEVDPRNGGVLIARLH